MTAETVKFLSSLSVLWRKSCDRLAMSCHFLILLKNSIRLQGRDSEAASLPPIHQQTTSTTCSVTKAKATFSSWETSENEQVLSWTNRKRQFFIRNYTDIKCLKKKSNSFILINVFKKGHVIPLNSSLHRWLLLKRSFGCNNDASNLMWTDELHENINMQMSKKSQESTSEENVAQLTAGVCNSCIVGPTSSLRSAGFWSERRSSPRRFPSPPWAPRTCRPRRGRRPTSAARCPASQWPGVKTGRKQENNRHHASGTFWNTTPVKTAGVRTSCFWLSQRARLHRQGGPKRPKLCN